MSRLSLAFPLETRERLEQLRENSGAPTLTDTVANAIRVYEWLVSTQATGGRVLVQRPGEDAKFVEFVF
jgi:hypothetical protein